MFLFESNKPHAMSTYQTKINSISGYHNKFQMMVNYSISEINVNGNIYHLDYIKYLINKAIY